MCYILDMQNVFDYNQNANYAKDLLLGGLYQYSLNIYGHGLYSDRPGTAAGLTICKMCAMHIFYALKE